MHLAGASFVESRLRSGNALSRLVLTQGWAGCSKCVAWLPDGIDDARLRHFEEGGIASAEESYRRFAGEIRSHLALGGDRVVVFEDAVSRRGDAALAQLSSRAGFYREEVYHLLLPSDVSDYAIEVTVSAADSADQLVCFLTRSKLLIERADEKPFAEISEGELEELAQRTDGVIVKAYDGEAFIICRSPASSSLEA